MEFKGTKGKWEIKKRANGCFYINAQSWGKFCQVYSITDTKWEEQSKANALLISKAPEMLEMLKEIKSRLKGNGFPSLTAMVEQLIKEATEI